MFDNFSYFKKECFFYLVIFLSLLSPGLIMASNGTGYRIGAKDILILSVIAGGEEQSKVELVVSEQGEINVPFIGHVKAVGLTLSQLEKKVHTPLEADYFVEPEVHIRIKEYHSLQYFISGAVRNPGMYKLGFSPTVMDLLAKAGGTMTSRGNVAYILKDRGEGSVGKEIDVAESPVPSKTRMVNLLKLLDEGDMSENFSLESGDTIYIPLSKKLNQSQTNIFVEGEVKTPGIFDFQPGLTALAACIMAGGFDKYAAPSRARIIRRSAEGQKIIKIDLEQVKKGEIPDPLLKPGDRIHVPESWL